MAPAFGLLLPELGSGANPVMSFSAALLGPFFTAADPALVRTGGGRDPLSLQPVWSAFGRELVPHLASPVRHLVGVKGVVLIHWLEQTELAEFLKTGHYGLRGYFRLMEGLLECFLWQRTEGDRRQHCYGTRALSGAGYDFRVRTDDPRTVANGLYQYYRGTCRRAVLLGNDWLVAPDVASVLASAWTPDATSALKDALRTPLEAAHGKGKRGELAPAVIFDGSAALHQALDAVFDDNELQKILKERLLGAEPFKQLAQHCAAILDEEGELAGKGLQEGGNKWRLDSLYERLAHSSDKAAQVEQARQCEAFLTVLYGCFDYLRASDGARLDRIATELSDWEQLVADRAGVFLRLEGVQNSVRVQQIMGLAQVAREGLKAFFEALLAHHERCMRERGRDPLLINEAGVLRALAASDAGKEPAQRRLANGEPWENDYYFAVAAAIYRQLFGGAER